MEKRETFVKWNASMLVVVCCILALYTSLQNTRTLPPYTHTDTHLPLTHTPKSLRQDLTSDMDLSPQLYSLAHQLVSESKGSAHSSRKH